MGHSVAVTNAGLLRPWLAVPTGWAGTRRGGRPSAWAARRSVRRRPV